LRRKAVSEAVDTIKSDEKGGVGTFIRETREELDRVSYPSREDVQGTTLIVIINVIFFAIFLYLIDQAWIFILMGVERLVNLMTGV
jgi:preprotein translocase SecE subunit